MPTTQMKKSTGTTGKANYNHKHATMPRKGPGKAATSSPVEHFLNLRCPHTDRHGKPDCDYLAKTTNILLEKGRLRCPLHHTVMRTKDERGETRGRHHVAA